MIVLAGCFDAFVSRDGGTDELRIATTTSLDDSGLLSEILPDFEAEYDVNTDVIAVGTGQAIVLGERGDVDVILVHAPEQEEEFVASGYGVERTTLMSNPFILVGPENDPSGVHDANDAADAFSRIAEREATFISRGDDSGTHVQELSIWAEAELAPETGLDWYQAAGQGMGETLLTANELRAYTLTDRATFVAIDDAQVSGLISIYGSPGQIGDGDPLLENPYSVIPVNPEIHEDTQIDLARSFVDWLTSDSAREAVAVYGQDKYGESLFTLVD